MYDYALLLTASWLAYRGAPAIAIVVIAMLLSLPRVVRDANSGALSLETAASAANAMLFAAIAHMVGAGVGVLLSA